jgi:hypothetical protein
VLDGLIELASVFEEVAVWGRGPDGLMIDGEGSIYITEFRGGHRRKFAPDGELLFEVGGTGNAAGQLGNPTGVAVALEGTIYV